VAPLQEETWGVILGDGAIFPADTHLDQPQPVAGSSSVATVIKEAAEAPVAGAMAVEIPSSPALSLSALVATSSWSLDKVEPSLTAADFEEAAADCPSRKNSAATNRHRVTTIVIGATATRGSHSH